MIRRAYMAAAALAVTAGCHRHVDQAGANIPTTSATDTTVRGFVRTVGADPLPQVVVRPDDGGPGVGIIGVLQREIGSLDGLELSISGPVMANQPPRPPRAVNVQRYDILSVGGTPAHSGVLTRRGNALWILGRDSVELVAPVPANLASLMGSRVYAAGPIESGRLRVEAFGAIGRR